jgi:alkylhydroperoxidase family enzyme
MRLTTPRITPSEAGDWGEEQRELIARFEKGVGPINVMRTMIRHPNLVRRWLPFTNHILYKSTLPARDREIVILRVAWNTQAEYEWGQHVVVARREGLSDDEIERTTAGAEAAGWTDLEAALIRAADELEADSFITDATWEALSRHYDEQQLMDLIFTVGNYRALACVINSLGVQLDEGVPGFPK